MIGEFDERGCLKSGIHRGEWTEFQKRFGTNIRRRIMLAGLKRAIASLRHAGCTLIYVDGSFVTEKEHPNDYDVVWYENGVNVDELDAVFLKLDDERRAQKIKYYGEFFSSKNIVAGTNMGFLNFFQKDRNSKGKGIVAIDIGEEF